MNLKDKVVLITGANGGLGQAFVNYCLEKEVKKIYCCARNIENLNGLNILDDDRVEVFKLDITNNLDIEKLVNSIDYIDILINNAGVNNEKRIFEILRNDFEVNVFGTLNVTKLLYPKIKENGVIITINSVLAFMNLPSMAQYCASKSALHSIMQAIRMELKTKAIDVYEVFPGPMDTKMSKNLEMQKATPAEVVKNTFEGLKGKSFEIFPDEASLGIMYMLKNNPKQLEKDFSSSIL